MMKNNIRAIHVDYTLPRRGADGEYSPADFDILTAVISALKWRENNGTIKLVTDSCGRDFYERCGLIGIWDGGCETYLDDIDKDINADPQIFWSCGKIYALSRETLPLAVMDTDFIVWEHILTDDIKDIAVIHSEKLSDDVYPDDFLSGFPDMDPHILPCNTAFYIIKNKALADMYTKTAISFMNEYHGGKDTLRPVVFAEQRLLSMCAEALGIKISVLSDEDKLFGKKNTAFTHTWGMKQQMRDDPELRRIFCGRCIKRIDKDFPQMNRILRGIPCLSEYYLI